MKIGKANVDFDTLIIETIDGQTFMEPKVMKVLKVLADTPGNVVTRDQLIDAVWGVGFGADERLTRAISLLRKALGDTGKPAQYIRTVPRTGYQLIAETSTQVDLDAQTVPAKATDEIVENHQQKPPTSYASRILVSTISALIVFSLVTFINWNRTNHNDRVTSHSVATGLDSILNYTRKGAIDDAQTNFEVILSDDPDHAAARAGLSLALIREYTHLERDPALLNRAHSTAEAAYRLDENLALANIALGWTTGLKGQYDTAHTYLDRADMLDPDNELMLEGRARTFMNQGDYESARLTVDDALTHHPENPIFHSYTGILHLHDQELELAELSFRNAIEHSGGTNPRAYGQLGHALHHQGKTDQAIQVLQDGLEINESTMLYNNLGTYLYFQGQYDMAARAFEKTIEYSGDTHDYLYWANLGDAYRQIPSKTSDANIAYDRAIQLLSDQIETTSANHTLISRLTLYHAKRGNIDEAWEKITFLKEEPSIKSSDLFRMALIYEVLSNRDLALSYLEKAMRAGYTMKEILHEPELDRLRQDKDFHILITSLEKENE